MKIISDFKDYYDYGMAFGVDEGIVYERFQKKIHPPKHIERKHGGVLGFCDGFWEVKEVEIADVLSYSWRHRREGRAVTYEERAKDLIKAGWTEGSPIFDVYNRASIKAYYWLRPIKNINTEEWRISSWRSIDYSHWNNWVKSIFTEYSVPSFFIEEKDPHETILNPILLDFGLQKLMDPVEAFQKLSTFIPSLRPVDDFDMTDEQLGKSKGFDEYSFRNKNTKNKPKKF